MLPVLYGFAGPEAITAAEAGTATLGGCILGDPSYICRRCRDMHLGDSPWPAARTVQ